MMFLRLYGTLNLSAKKIKILKMSIFTIVNYDFPNRFCYLIFSYLNFWVSYLFSGTIYSHINSYWNSLTYLNLTLNLCYQKIILSNSRYFSFFFQKYDWEFDVTPPVEFLGIFDFCFLCRWRILSGLCVAQFFWLSNQWA